MNKENTTEKESVTKQEFAIQRIYLKDLSFEAPGMPDIFRAEWNPKAGIDLDSSWKKLEEDLYEVVLRVTASVKLEEKNAFLIEVQYAGIFTIKNFSDEQLGHMTGSFCPNILFPYAREIISDTANRASFPPLYLAPVNFDLLYQQHLAKKKTEKDTETE